MLRKAKKSYEEKCSPPNSQSRGQVKKVQLIIDLV